MEPHDASFTFKIVASRCVMSLYLSMKPQTLYSEINCTSTMEQVKRVKHPAMFTFIKNRLKKPRISYLSPCVATIQLWQLTTEPAKKI